MTNDVLVEILMKWPPGTDVTILVDVNMSVDIEGISSSSKMNQTGQLVPVINIELPTPDISTVPPLTVVQP